MLNRVELKNRAKSVLKEKYWMCLAVSALVGVLSQVVPQISFRLSKVGDFTLSQALQQPEYLIALGIPALIIILCLLLLDLAFSIFFVTPLTVGAARFYTKASTGQADYKEVFHVFKIEHYMNVVKTMFMRDIKLLLWSLCYIIPFSVSIVLCAFNGLFVILTGLSFLGLIPMIMKSYSYFLTDWILADNPTINWKECLAESERMMSSCRFETFVLQLSFFGWILLGTLLCGVGAFFATPYIQATMTQLYLSKKDENTTNDFISEIN